jgi:hypothetical protein
VNANHTYSSNQQKELFMAQEIASVGTSGYEFTPAQNMTIQVLGQRMKFIGILNMVFAGFMTIGGVIVLFKFPIQAIVAFAEVALFAFMGLWNYKGAASFKMIVETSGNDIAHLMNALEDLRKIYNLQYWLMIIVLVLVAIGIIAAVLLMSSGAMPSTE